MAYAFDFITLRWNLAYVNGTNEEQATWTMKIAKGSSATQGDLNSLNMSAVSAAGTEILNGLKDTGTTTKLAAPWSGRSVHAMLTGTNGLKVPGSLSREAAWSFGGAGTQAMPLNVAICVTLQSSESFGPGRFGRFYLPAPSISGGYWNISSGMRNNITSATANAINALNQALPSGYRVVVASQGGSKAGSPTMRAVSIVSVDSIPDTMRKRTNQLFRERTSTPLAG